MGAGQQKTNCANTRVLKKTNVMARGIRNSNPYTSTKRRNLNRNKCGWGWRWARKYYHNKAKKAAKREAKKIRLRKKYFIEFVITIGIIYLFFYIIYRITK
jgi:hypothetical protein